MTETAPSTPPYTAADDRARIETRLAEILPGIRILAAARMGGMTNRSYRVTTDTAGELAVRLPGVGTEAMINRGHERISTELATRLGIDTELIHFGDDGFKVSRYIPGAHTMDARDLRTPEAIEQVAAIFRRLHDCAEDTHVPFEVFDMARQYEAVLETHGVALPEDYRRVKAEVFRIKARTDAESEIRPVPCHNDALCANWVSGKGQLFLIDWEYAGMNDPLWDLADVSIEADYTPAHDRRLLAAYFGHPPTPVEARRFLANRIYLDYLWTLWGLTRVPYDGAELERYAAARYRRLRASMAAYAAAAAEPDQ